MVQALVAPEDQAENIFRVTSNAKDLPETLNQIFSFTFNTSPRLFYIQEIDAVPLKQRRDFIERLHQGGIPANTFIIFAVSDAKIANELNSKFKQQSEKIDFWAPFANQLGAWVKKEISELGSEISAEAADLVTELVGSDLAILHQELSKLAVGHPGKKIGIAEVKAGVGYLRQDNVFDFLEAFSRRNPEKCMRIIESLVNRGEAPQKIWFMLCRQLRDFRLFHEIANDRPDLFEKIVSLLRNYRQIADKSDFKGNQEKKNLLAQIQQHAEEIPDPLAKAAGLKQANKLRNLYLAMNFDRSELANFWPSLIKTDLNLKSGCPDARACLQNFVVAALKE
jgi:DNA polymerase III delta subunit